MKRTMATAVFAACALAGSMQTAFADDTQIASGVAVNSIDLANYAASAALQNAGTPDVTCGTPEVAAGPVTPAVSYVVGEVYGEDVAAASGQCLSLQGHSYNGTITVSVQYQPFAGASFVDIPGCQGSSTGPSINGVLVLASPVVPCQYRLGSAYAGKPHRGYALLTNTEVSSAKYEGASPTPWPGSLAATSI